MWHIHTHARTHARTHSQTIFVCTAAAAPKMAFSCTILRWRLWRLVSAERRVVVCDGGMRWRRDKVPSECETRAAAPLTLWRCSAGSRRRSARRRFPVQGCSTEVHSACHVCLFATYRPGSCCLRCAPQHFPRLSARPPARRPDELSLRGVCAVYGSTSTFQRRAAATTRRRTGATPRARTGRRSRTSGRSAAAEISRYEIELIIFFWRKSTLTGPVRPFP